MTLQTFKYAGYSVTADGQTKARFGNDMVSRVKKLSGTNSDIWFEELPKAMTKKHQNSYLRTIGSIVISILKMLCSRSYFVIHQREQPLHRL